MKKILVLEDKEIHIKMLEKVLEDIHDVTIFAATSVEMAYKIVMENTINLLLIDIILDTAVKGDVSGLKFAHAIRKIPKYAFTPLIFITSLEDPKLYAYKELHCFGYIEKPFDPPAVKKLTKQALEFPNYEIKDKNIYFRTDGIMYAVNSKDIIYIENSKRKLVIHTTKEKFAVPYKTCKEMLEELETDNFLQCSRYVIINKDYVELVDYANRYIKLRGIDEAVEIGVAMKKRVMDEFSD